MKKSLIIPLVITALGVLVIVGFLALPLRKEPGTETDEDDTGSAETASADVEWRRTGSGWRAIGTPPACPEPLSMQAPVNTSLATSVLYPGQTRGGDYKAHGGFRFDNADQNAVSVEAPMDALVVEASRYIERGEVQYLFTFINPCGIMYRFDHLLRLSPQMQRIADALPEAKEGDSRTTAVDPAIPVLAGEILATGVGFAETGNTFVDFGVYDLRQKNAASQDADWAATHSLDLAQHAICWFDLLPGLDAERIRSLPAADSTSGATSDYCSK